MRFNFPHNSYLVFFIFCIFYHLYYSFSQKTCFAFEPDNINHFESKKNSYKFSFEGFVEFENFINIHKNHDFTDVPKKNEIRCNFRLKYGIKNLYLFSEPNVYLLLSDNRFKKTFGYNDKTKIFKNIRYASKSYEIVFDEMYLHYEKENFRIRIGNQIFRWGTGDVFNPTAFFNPLDSREIFFKDEDEYKVGVLSLSGMVFFDDYTLEIVFAPFHISGTMAQNGNFWYITPDNYKLPVFIDKPCSLGNKTSNFSYGARISKNFSGKDISLSLYHGPDKEYLFLPAKTALIPNSPVTVLIEPATYVISSIGLDYSMSLHNFVVQIEAAYSPNKKGFLKQSLHDTKTISFPFKTVNSGYISYTAGFNYFIPLYNIWKNHGGDTIFTFEWYQSKYFKKNLSKPLLTDIVLCRLEYNFFNNYFILSFTSIIDTQKKGHLFWPKISLNFSNSCNVELAYAKIDGKISSLEKPESLFYYLKDNDILILKFRYNF